MLAELHQKQINICAAAQLQHMLPGVTLVIYIMFYEFIPPAFCTSDS